jgi:uncharacterized membrane protein YhaH (DUF805 family)
LFFGIVQFLAKIVDYALFGANMKVLYFLAALGLLVPYSAVAVRRLHDTARSGWFILLPLIPIIGAIVLIVWNCQRGTFGPNRYGPDPLRE